MLWFWASQLLTTLISQEKIKKKKNWVKNSWGFDKIEFLDNFGFSNSVWELLFNTFKAKWILFLIYKRLQFFLKRFTLKQLSFLCPFAAILHIEQEKKRKIIIIRIFAKLVILSFPISVFLQKDKRGSKTWIILGKCASLVCSIAKKKLRTKKGFFQKCNNGWVFLIMLFAQVAHLIIKKCLGVKATNHIIVSWFLIL